MNEIKNKENFKNGDVPYTLIYERALLSDQDQTNSEQTFRSIEFDIKQKLAKRMKEMVPHRFYEVLAQLEISNFLTTNYDYCLKSTFLKDEEAAEKNLSTEDIYSVRRRTLISKQNKEICNIWQIHGEIDAPASIMLGFDQYCGSIGKLDAYIKGNYEFMEDKKPFNVLKMVEKLTKKKFDNKSWIELFFNTDLHILGISLDFSETDIWWLLNKRARIYKDPNNVINVKNEIYFYTKDITEEKKSLLESFKVTVVVPEERLTYEQFYEFAIEKIRKN